MIGELLQKYTVENWQFLDIQKETLAKRYSWISSPMIEINKIQPWAVRNDIGQLFYLCVSYESIHEFSEAHSELLTGENINQIQLQLIHNFCYSKEENHQDLDILIERCTNEKLLHFIYAVLDRGLLWYNPEPCWPSELRYILRNGKAIIESSINQGNLSPVTTLELKGVDLVTTDAHTHVYYKFQVICEQLQHGKIYTDLKTIAKQAHMALMQSIQLQFEYRITGVDQITFEQKIDHICHKETIWCANLLKNA